LEGIFNKTPYTPTCLNVKRKVDWFRSFTFRQDKIENLIWDWARFDLYFIESANIAYLFASKDVPCLKSIFFSSCRYIKINPNWNFDLQFWNLYLLFYILTWWEKKIKKGTSSAKLKKDKPQMRYWKNMWCQKITARTMRQVQSDFGEVYFLLWPKGSHPSLRTFLWTQLAIT